MIASRIYAETVADLKAAIRDTVDDNVVTGEQIGKLPDKPYSSTVMFRLAASCTRRLLRRLPYVALSLNQRAEAVVRPTPRQTLQRV